MTHFGIMYNLNLTTRKNYRELFRDFKVSISPEILNYILPLKLNSTKTKNT